MENEVNHEWENIKSIIFEWDEEIIKTRKKATTGGIKNVQRPPRRKILPERNSYQKRTRATEEQYTQTRKEAKKICKEEKKQCLNNRLKQIEEAHKQKRNEVFLRTYEHLNTIALLPYLFVKMKIVDYKQISKKLWEDGKKIYSADLMKSDKINYQTQEESFKENETEIEQPTYKDVK